ncbi:MAG: GTP-binding protein [Promethearchaeota archaeon]
MEDALNIKVIVLGDGNVGKTSLVSNFLGKEIPEKYLPTIGNNIFRKDYKLNNQRIRINIWDIGGQKSFNVFNPAVYNNVDAAFLVFDLSRPKETLLNIIKEYKEILERYSKDSLSIIVGNKLDLVSFDEYLKQIIKNILSLGEQLLLISAKTGENVNESFELLIYTFLKNAGIDKIAKEFINLIGKNEKKLKTLLVNLISIDSILEKKKSKSKITDGLTLLIETEGDEIVNYDLIQEELKKIEILKSDVFNNFYKNLSEVEELINYLKKSKNLSVEETVDTLKEQLITIKEDFEFGVNSIKDIEKEENEFVKILTQIKEVEEKTELLKAVSDDELYKIYEKENPRKKAIWRAKETKGFIEWKKKYLEI